MATINHILALEWHTVSEREGRWVERCYSQCAKGQKQLLPYLQGGPEGARGAGEAPLAECK